MSIQISGIQLGPIHGGPSALTLEDLHDVTITSPLTGQYLRYNSSIVGWQNAFINSDVYGYLSTNLTSSNGINLTQLSGPETIDISLALSATGDATGSVLAGMLPLTLNTVNNNVGTFGSSTMIPVITVNAKGLITGVTVVATGGAAPVANNLAGGTAGALPYQSAVSTTSFVPPGANGNILTMVAGFPTWSSGVLINVTVTGTSQLAVSGNRYILVNVASTTVILPALPNVNDIVSIKTANGLATNMVDPNGQTIEDQPGTMILNLPQAPLNLQFLNNSWRII